MTTRRGFLAGILAMGAAPAIVRAENLMKLWTPPKIILDRGMTRAIFHVDESPFISGSHFQQLSRFCTMGADFDGDVIGIKQYIDYTNYPNVKHDLLSGEKNINQLIKELQFKRISVKRNMLIS